MSRSAWIVVAVVLFGCSSSDTVAFDAERPWRQPGDVIDSILPMAEHERRFREGVPEVAALRGGAGGREALAERFLEAVAARDSVALGALLVDRAEFAWLVFPDHLYRRPPYELDPGTLWMQLQGSSAKGAARLLERLGGRGLEFRGLQCERDTMQLVESRMALWGPCQVQFRSADSVATRRLFGSIIERDGVFKFLSYANDF